MNVMDSVQHLLHAVGNIAERHGIRLTGYMGPNGFVPEINHASLLTPLIMHLFEKPPSYLTGMPTEPPFPPACYKALAAWHIPTGYWYPLCAELLDQMRQAVQHYVPAIIYDDPAHRYTYALCDEYDIYFSHTHEPHYA